MWVWMSLLLLLLAAVGLVTFDLLVHYWAGRFRTWIDLRHHLLFLIGLRKVDRPLRAVKGKFVSDGKPRRPGSATGDGPDRWAAGNDTN